VNIQGDDVLAQQRGEEKLGDALVLHQTLKYGVVYRIGNDTRFRAFPVLFFCFHTLVCFYRYDMILDLPNKITGKTPIFQTHE
jgi:hypothetical protein